MKKRDGVVRAVQIGLPPKSGQQKASIEDRPANNKEVRTSGRPCERRSGALWRRPHQPHPGTQCSRCGCFLPDLTRFTGNRCGGTDGVTITTLTSRRAAPLYLSGEKLQPSVPDKKTEDVQALAVGGAFARDGGGTCDASASCPTAFASKLAPTENPDESQSREPALHSRASLLAML